LCLKFLKNIREFYPPKKLKFVKIHRYSFYNITSNCNVFEFAQHYYMQLRTISSAVDYTEATVEWEQWAVEDSDSDTREESKAADRRFVA